MDYIKTTINTYDKIANQYFSDFFDDEDDNKFVEEFAIFLPKQASVLDVGCGCGNLSKTLVNFGFDIVGIDLSQKMIEIARENVKDCTFTIGDMRNIDCVNSSFDGILASRSIIHISNKDIDLVFKEFYRLLKPNGILCILLPLVEESYEGFEKEVYNPELDMFYHYYSMEELKEILNRHNFNVIKYKIEEHVDKDSGKVVRRLQLFARK